MNTGFKLALMTSLSLTALIIPNAAFAQDAASAASGEQDKTIIVTGTRRTDRTVTDSTVPVDVITTETLTTGGYTETNRLLN